MNLLRFRSAKPGDVSVIHVVNAAAYLPAYMDVVDTAPEPVEKSYENHVARGDVCIAEVDGQAVGVVVMETRADHVFIYSVAVVPAAQNRGVGKALLLFSEHHAARKHLPELRLSTNLKMDKNIAVYREHGFVELGKRPHPFRPGEIEVDMAKPVDVQPLELPRQLD